MVMLCYVFYIVLLLWSPLKISAGCAKGFFKLNGSTQCFRFFRDVDRTWFEATEKCKAEGLLLPKPSDPVKLRKYLLDTYGSGNGVWLNARGDGSKFVWHSDGTEVSRTSPLWFPGWPAGFVRSDRCLSMLIWQNDWKNHPGRPFASDPCSHYYKTLCEATTGVHGPSTPSITSRPPPLPSSVTSSSPAPAITTALPPSQSPTRRSTSHPITIPSTTSRPASTSTPGKPDFGSCGHSTRFDERTVAERIANGQPAITGKWPWMVHFNYFSSFHEKNLPCGGTLIAKRWVISAAHCFRFLKPNIDVYVKIGFVHLKRQEPGSSLFSITKNDIITHDKFSATTLENDIALVHLPAEVTLSSLIQTICLGTNQNIPFGATAWAAGWGLLFSSDRDIPNILHDVELDVLEDDSCKSPQHFICTFTPGKDTCSGDSGGPLMVQQGSQWYQVGIVSHGPTDCGTHNSPAFYTRVSNHLAFISSIIKF